MSVPATHNDSDDDDTHCADPVSSDECVHAHWVDPYTGEPEPPPSRAEFLSMMSMYYRGPVLRRVTQPTRHTPQPAHSDSDSDQDSSPEYSDAVATPASGFIDIVIDESAYLSSIAVSRVEDGTVRVVRGP